MSDDEAGYFTAGDGAPAPIKILIIDSSDLGRACTAAVLERQRGLEIGTGGGVASYKGPMVPDVLLLQTGDSSAGLVNILELDAALRRWAGLPVLVVGDIDDVQQMKDAIDRGAQGILPATATVECICSAAILLANGMSVYPSGLITQFQAKKTASWDDLGHMPVEPGQLKSLTQRQQDVLHLLALGSSNRGIAERLKISESTVKVHLRAIMTQNGASNRTQIVARYLKGSRNGSGE